LIERSFQGLSIVIETVRIIEELVEIWPNEVCDNPTSYSRAKHIDIRFHFIQERTKRNEIKLQYISTHQMVANILTKALSRKAFKRFREALGVVKVPH